jgi:hypothetical protein
MKLLPDEVASSEKGSVIFFIDEHLPVGDTASFGEIIDQNIRYMYRFSVQGLKKIAIGAQLRSVFHRWPERVCRCLPLELEIREQESIGPGLYEEIGCSGVFGDEVKETALGKFYVCYFFSGP